MGEQLSEEVGSGYKAQAYAAAGFGGQGGGGADRVTDRAAQCIGIDALALGKMRRHTQKIPDR